MCPKNAQRTNICHLQKFQPKLQPQEGTHCLEVTAEVTVLRGQSPILQHKTLSDQPQTSPGAIATDGDEVQVFPVPEATPRAGLDLREGAGGRRYLLSATISC